MGRRSPRALLAHGAAFDAASWQDQATAIVAEGFTVVAVEDISAHAQNMFDSDQAETVMNAILERLDTVSP